MHQTKKGNQWHFGMKAHIGVDVASGLVHTVKGAAANEADITQTAALLHGEEEDVFGDAGYIGADKRPELEDRDVSWNIAIKRSIVKALPKGLRDLAEPVERALSQVRAVVEHPFHIVKNLFRHKKLRYRGLEENTAQRHTLFALANLVMRQESPARAAVPGLSAPGLCSILETTQENLATAADSANIDRFQARHRQQLCLGRQPAAATHIIRFPESAGRGRAHARDSVEPGVRADQHCRSWGCRRADRRNGSRHVPLPWRGAYGLV